MESTKDNTKDSELAQARLRNAVSFFATLYVLGIYALGEIDRHQVLTILLYNLGFAIASYLLLFWVRCRPGIYPLRRLMAIVHDYAGISFAMIVGGEPMVPLFSLILWVTLGNGMRYGSRYLTLATVLALLAEGAVAFGMPFLRDNLYVLLLLWVATLVVPAYAHILLSRTRRASQAAFAASRAKSRFLAQASHDLRQPIHAISLFTACLRDADLSEDARQMVENIDISLTGVSRLFQSILDLYTLDSGQVAVQRQPVALHQLLADLIRQNAEAGRWKNVTLHLRAPPCWVETDPALLTTLLQNLLSNAIKYAPGGRVLVGCRRHRGGVAIDVFDSGRGIPADALPHVFDEFYRAQAKGEDIEGLGLGLTIVRRLASLLELEIGLQSQLGRGTRVRLTGLARTTEPARVRVDKEDLGAPAVPLGGLRVLLIEDDHSVRQAMATLLRRWGCEVRPVASVPKLEEPCDLVISDFDLGTQAASADCLDYLLRLSAGRVPAVVMTGHEIGAVRQALTDPAIPVLAKPVRPAELRALLSSLRLRRDEGA